MSLSGSVTLANTRLSLANGYAFFDTSAANADYANNINSQIEVTSVTTGKKAIGYIKAVGTGETYGTELLTNGDFAIDGTWNKGLGWTIGGGKATFNAATSARIYQDVSGVVGRLYLSSIEETDHTAGTQQLNFAGIPYLYFSTVATHTQYKTAGVDYRWSVWGGTNGNASIDNTSCKQVLTPSATGVTITSTPNGSTYNWASIEAGFNYNDESGYTWKIIPHTRFSRGRRRYIDAYGIERTVFYK
jgi:hypothetical protein